MTEREKSPKSFRRQTTTVATFSNQQRAGFFHHHRDKKERTHLALTFWSLGSLSMSTCQREKKYVKETEHSRTERQKKRPEGRSTTKRPDKSNGYRIKCEVAYIVGGKREQTNSVCPIEQRRSCMTVSEKKKNDNPRR